MQLRLQCVRPTVTMPFVTKHFLGYHDMQLPLHRVRFGALSYPAIQLQLQHVRPTVDMPLVTNHTLSSRIMQLPPPQRVRPTPTSIPTSTPTSR